VKKDGSGVPNIKHFKNVYFNNIFNILGFYDSGVVYAK
jgi:hypothetical protein